MEGLTRVLRARPHARARPRRPRPRPAAPRLHERSLRAARGRGRSSPVAPGGRPARGDLVGRAQRLPSLLHAAGGHQRGAAVEQRPRLVHDAGARSLASPPRGGPEVARGVVVALRRNSISPSRSSGSAARGADRTHSRAARSALARSPAQRQRFWRSSSTNASAARRLIPHSEAVRAPALARSPCSSRVTSASMCSTGRGRSGHGPAAACKQPGTARAPRTDAPRA